jgi:hypothetical protein
MPGSVVISGCGRMACLTYAEFIAELDRARAVPPTQPLPLAELFASLATAAGDRAGHEPKARPRPLADPAPDPG